MPCQRLTILAACSNVKRGRPDGLIQLRDFNGDLRTRAEGWRRALDGSTVRTRAGELYGGAYWSSVLEARRAAEAAGLNVAMWVLSAGHGLIAEHDEIPPYSATFAPRQPDSVWRGTDDGDRRAANAAWWRDVNASPILDRLNADAPLLVIAGQDYVDVVAPELRHRNGACLIVSAGSTRSQSELPVVGDGALRSALGGTMNTLNAKTARWLIERHAMHDFDAGEANVLLDRLRDSTVSTERVLRRAASDDLITARVRTLIHENPAISRTRALRWLRDSEYLACEQVRFARLFAAASDQLGR